MMLDARKQSPYLPEQVLQRARADRQAAEQRRRTAGSVADREGPSSELATGMLVQHASLGIGKVVAIEPTAVHVFFPESEKRYAAKLHWPTAKALVRTEGLDRNPWLEGLSSFSLDLQTRRYALAANWVTHDEAIADFLVTYPKGFSDPAYLGTGSGKRERASRWRAARVEWTRALGDGQGERLLESGHVRELVRRALRIERHVVLVPGTFQAGALTNAFRDDTGAAGFFEALLGVLSVPSPARARFEKLFAATETLGVEPGLAWPIATLFPFVAEPSRQMFLWPKSACGAAERLGCDLRFEAALNWATYSALRSFAAQMLEKLKPSGATDFVDVEAFLQATATARPGSPRDGRARGSRRAVSRRAPRAEPERRATAKGKRSA